MKHATFILLVLVLALLTGCAAKEPAPGTAGVAANLLVTGGEISKSFTRADLEALPATESVFNDVTYQGVAVTAMIQAAGFDPAQVKAIKAVASDGYTVNYDTDQVFGEDIIVAYARADGDLEADDGAFRMVLPGAEGKLNVRMLVELQVIQ